MMTIIFIATVAVSPIPGRLNKLLREVRSHNTDPFVME